MPSLDEIRGWFIAVLALEAQSYTQKGKLEIKGDDYEGERLHFEIKTKGVEMEGYYTYFVRRPFVIQVHAWAHKKIYPEVKDELEAIIDSFEPPSIGAL